MLSTTTFLALGWASTVLAHAGHDQQPISGPHQSLWYQTLPGDGGTQADSVFSGISTFGRLPYMPCLAHRDIQFDIARLMSFQVLPSIPARPTGLVPASVPRVSARDLEGSIYSTSV